jgi:hypothetical protein
MLYLFEVYALVIAAVLLPLLFLYLAVAVARMALSSVSMMFRNLTNVLWIRTAVLRQRWSLIHR